MYAEIRAYKGGSVSNEKNIAITDCHQNHFTVFQYDLHKV